MISQLNYNDDLKNMNFSDFFSKFINLMYLDKIKLSFNNFKQSILTNLNDHYIKFVNNFEQFNLFYIIFNNYKHF